MHARWALPSSVPLLLKNTRSCFVLIAHYYWPIFPCILPFLLLVLVFFLARVSPSTRLRFTTSATGKIPATPLAVRFR